MPAPKRSRPGSWCSNAATEIVITRNGIANVVAELDNVEEITINTGAGADTVTAVGNFGPTSLFFNTITVNGQGGRDTIDASQLTSAHKLVLNRGPGEDTGIARCHRRPWQFSTGLMMRMAAHELDCYGQPASPTWARQVCVIADGNHNPMFDSRSAVDSR